MYAYDRRFENYTVCTDLHAKIAKVRNMSPPSVSIEDINEYRNGNKNMSSLLRHIALFGVTYMRAQLSHLTLAEIDEVLYHSICYDGVKDILDLVPLFGNKCFKVLHPEELPLVVEHLNSQQLYDACVVYVTNRFDSNMAQIMNKYLLQPGFKERLRKEPYIKREWFEWLL
jgi:hypothetical protein